MGLLCMRVKLFVIFYESPGAASTVCSLPCVLCFSVPEAA